MFDKYREWIDKATAHAIVGDRALILLGDSLDILLDTTLAADSVICDPPYDFDAEGGPTLFGRKSKSSFVDMRERGLAKGFDHRILEAAALAPSMAVFFHNDQLAAISALLSNPRKVMMTADPEEPLYNSVFVDGPPLYDRSVLCGWSKLNPMPVANKHYVPDTELYIHAWRPPAFPQGDISDKGRFILAPVGKSEWDHPTVKPQKVMRKVVTNASKAGDIILDPFSGSGSTGVAALSLGRFFIGIEKDPEFYELTKERLSLAAQVPYGDGQQKGLF